MSILAIGVGLIVWAVFKDQSRENRASSKTLDRIMDVEADVGQHRGRLVKAEDDIEAMGHLYNSVRLSADGALARIQTLEAKVLLLEGQSRPVNVNATVHWPKQKVASAPIPKYVPPSPLPKLKKPRILRHKGRQSER